ncbi:MAG: helix-turn-helix domain-containing protein [Candidatus Obscuribacterales bacterium]|nr:helix-turn-helix domain-containing protein [Candidatus Obscuribacterales bacterium]
MGWGWGFQPYVSVAERRAKAKRKMDDLRKRGIHTDNVVISGRKIASTFWGQGWCKHIEGSSDYANRLPRGRSYVRQGSVVHLEIAPGKVKAMVNGSDLYDVVINIKPLAAEKWRAVKDRCVGKIASLLELLQGRLSTSVMEVVTKRDAGLFPLPKEITFNCSCPDHAVMCKHVAAVLYGVGARLDERPELLFQLRGVDHLELIEADSVVAAATAGKSSSKHIAESELEDLFGIEIAPESPKNDRHERVRETTIVSEPKKPNTNLSIKRKTAPIVSKPSQKETSAKGKTQKTSAQDLPDTRLLRSIISILPSSNSLPEKAPAPAKPKAPKPSKLEKPDTKLLKSVISLMDDFAPTGEYVRELRARLNLSQAELAELVGASTTSVKKWEKETGRLTLQKQTASALVAVNKLTKKQAFALLSSM